MVKEQGVAELQGMYGPVRVSERFLQLIWRRGRLAREDLLTDDGRRLRLISPGKWNHAEGPDFHGARWQVDGGPVETGDVELHFYAEDWGRHGHGSDANYNGVGLHVTLFPPGAGAGMVETQAGGRPLTLSLLPFLEEDLESLAEEEALLQMDERWDADWLGRFANMAGEDRARRLVEGAGRRWRRKRARAAVLLETQDWEQALHEKTLEVLGYSRNREPMRRLAAEFPHALLSGGEYAVETLYLAQRGSWKTVGLRPANHPRRRLGQYLELMRARPLWAGQVETWAGQLCEKVDGNVDCDATATRRYRRGARLIFLRRELRERLLDERITGTRLETWVAEALLPLFAARTGVDCFALWYHWFAGDFPDVLRKRGMAVFGKGPEAPVASNGLFQGLMDVIMEEETGYVQLEFADLAEGFSGEPGTENRGL